VTGPLGSARRPAPACWSTRLSDEQLRFYFLHQLDPRDPDIHICRTLRVRGPLDVERLRAAVDDLAARHDVLRSCYPEVDGQPQIWLRDDVAGAFAVAPVASDAPFALAEGPLFRVTVIPGGDGDHVVELRFHHIIVDGASVHLFLRGLLDTYQALGQGRSLARPAHQYHDYLAWEATRVVDGRGMPPAGSAPEWGRGSIDRGYWARTLEGAVVLDLATARSRPERHTRAAGVVHVDARPELVVALRAACRSHRVTPYLVMMAVFQILLHRVTGQDDVLVATPIAARPRLDFQAMLGVLVRWTAFRARLRPEMTFAEVLAQVRAAAPDALAHSAPYEALLAAAGSLPRDPAHNSLFQVTLNYATLGALVAPPGLAVTIDPITTRATPYDLAARFEEVGDTLRLELAYYEGALDRAEAGQLADALLALAAHCLAQPDAPLGAPARRVALAATFTAEQLRPALAYWLALVHLRVELAIAPIDQVFQTVLATGPATPLVLLVRADDWKDPLAGAAELRRLLAARGGETILAICPSRVDDPRFAAALADVRAHVVPWQAIVARYPVTAIHDADADADGRAPYSEDFDLALATALARALHAALRPAPKVLVLDCDHTLWRGVIGEDGVGGVVVDDGHRALQAFAVAQRAAGVLLALASKNNEAEVWEAFDQVPGMVLRREMITAHRIHWEPKSHSLRSLAAELDLGLDAFVFLDDSPAECAEVRAALPAVTVLQVPGDGDIADFLAHLWPFDARPVTETDRARAELYAVNARRQQLRAASTDLRAFVASLEVRVAFVPLSPSTAPRVAQLTQRTNQLNTTTLRRSEAELAAAVADGAQVLIADVSDRFGDYGITGVAIYRVTAEALEVDSLLLSCRALGRGVEQAMLVELGQIAAQACLPAIELAYRGTPRNQPALRFLEALTTRVAPERFRVTVADARAAGAKLVTEPVGDDAAVPVVAPAVAPAVWQRIARELSSVPRIRAAIAATQPAPRRAPGAYVAPGDELEARIAEIWREAIGVAAVGASDDYFALGGDSIRILAVVSRLRKVGVPASVRDIYAHPTVARLAHALRDRSAPAPVAHPAPPTSGPYPLALSQAFVIRAYARANLDAGRAPSGAFHIQDRLALRDPRGLAVEALRRAIEVVVRRTPALRTAIFRDGARWLQVEGAVMPTLAIVDLAGLEREDQDARVAALCDDDRARPFDPERTSAAMIRFHAAVRGATELELIVAAHHGFCDGWSLHNLYNQLLALYEAHRADDRARVAALDGALARHEHGFRALVAREHEIGAHDAFWRGYLADQRGAPRPAAAPSGGTQAQLGATLDRAVVARAVARAAASRTSLKAVLLEALFAALARGLATRAPIVVATVTNGRTDDLDAPTDVFGLCWTFAPIACAAGDRTARLAGLHRDLTATELHARYPVDAMFAGLDPVASFNFAHFHNARWSRADEGVTLARHESFHRFDYPLNVNVRRDDDDLRVTASWSAQVHDERFVRALLDDLAAALAGEPVGEAA